MKLKRWAALLLTGVLTFSLTGCLGRFFQTAMIVDGQEISAGIYLAIQMNAYNEAKNLVDDPEKDVLKQKVEGQNAVDWIRARTEENVRKYVAVDRMAKEREIVLSEENRSYLDQTLGYWSMTEEMYTRNGISKESMSKVMANNLLMEELFLNLYGPEGELAPPESELRTLYAEQNAHVRYIMIPINASEGMGDKSAEVKQIADDMLVQLKAGATMEEVADVGMREVYGLLGREFDEASTVTNSISASYINYTPNDEGTYSPEFLEELQNQKVGDFGLYQMSSIILLYQKIEPFEGEEFEDIRPTIVRSLYFKDFEKYLADIYNQYTVERPFGAAWYLSPRKIKK